jgi:anti-sigma factor RsiW
MARDEGANGAGIGSPALVPDEELNAYIDGELAQPRRRAIERLIASDERVRARIEVLLCTRELVRMAYTPTTTE